MWVEFLWTSHCSCWYQALEQAHCFFVFCFFHHTPLAQQQAMGLCPIPSIFKIPSKVFHFLPPIAHHFPGGKRHVEETGDRPAFREWETPLLLASPYMGSQFPDQGIKSTPTPQQKPRVLTIRPPEKSLRQETPDHSCPLTNSVIFMYKPPC